MQGTLPVQDARDRKPGWPRRGYIMAGLVLVLLVLLVIASSIAVQGWLRPSSPGPRKLWPETGKLAASYRYSETLTDAFGPQSWSPDGRYLVTYSTSTPRMQVHDLGGPSPRAWSVPAEASYSYEGIGIADKAMWSPDSRLLAVDEANTSVPYTITLVEAEKGTVRNTIRVLGPPDLPSTSTSQDQASLVHTFHQLVGWGDNGRSLVTLMFVERRDEAELNPAPVQPVPVPVPTSQPVVTPVGPSFSVYFYVHDAVTGDMVSSTQVYSTTSYPRIYGLALSPDGGTLAFATTSDTPPSTGSMGQVNLDLWDLRTGRLKYGVHDLGDAAIGPFLPILDQFLAWSLDSSTLYLASGSTVKVIEVATGKIVRTLPDVVPPTSTPAPTDPPPLTPLPGTSLPQPSPGVPATPTPDPGRYYPIVSIELSPSGDRLAVVDYRALRVWETASGKLHMLTSMPGTVPSSLNASMYFHSHARLTWLADGSLLASHFSDYGPGIWLIDPENGVHLRQLAEYPQYVAWSPATNMLAMEVERNHVEIWRGDDGLGPTAGPTSSLVP